MTNTTFIEINNFEKNLAMLNQEAGKIFKESC